MKKVLRCKIFLFCLGLGGACLYGYQIPEPGLFYAHTLKTPIYKQNQPMIAYEKRADGLQSNVRAINGISDFDQHVLKASWHRPVVIKVFSSASFSSDIQNMHQIFLGVADLFKENVIFVSVDTFARTNDEFENEQIIEKIKKQAHLLSIKQPFLIFLKNGALYTPEQLPAPVLQGLFTEDELVSFIKTKFSLGEEQVIFADSQGEASGIQDLTTTVTTQLNNQSTDNNREKNAKKTLWQRLFGSGKVN